MRDEENGRFAGEIYEFAVSIAAGWPGGAEPNEMSDIGCQVLAVPATPAASFPFQTQKLWHSCAS
jgi:hypothetical protein